MLSLLQTYTYQTQKQGLSKSIKNSFKKLLKRACLTDLTKRNLKAFTKLENMKQQFKRELKRLSRFKLKSSHSKSKSFLSNKSKSLSKTVLTTDLSFAHLTFKNGILKQPNTKQPTNLDYKQERLNRTQETASLTKLEYKVAAYKIQTVENKQTVLLKTSKLLKDWNV